MRLLAPTLAVLVLFPRLAAADEPPLHVDRAAPAPTTSWYGWQTLALDGATVGAALALGSTRYNGGAGIVFLGGYLVDGPVVHIAHGHPKHALASAGLRVGLPVLGMYVGAAAAQCPRSGDSLCPLGAAVAGGAIGMLAAVITDAATSFETTTTPNRSPGVQVLGANVMPDIGVGPGGPTFALRGTY